MSTPTHPDGDRAGRPGSAGRSPAHLALLVLGGLLLVGGFIAVVVGLGQATGVLGEGTEVDRGSYFADDGTFAGPPVVGEEDHSFSVFAGGGLAMVVGLGVLAFTRVGMARRAGYGGYTRIVIEEGHGPGRPRAAVADARPCFGCGRGAEPGAAFCASCGSPLG